MRRRLANRGKGIALGSCVAKVVQGCWQVESVFSENHILERVRVDSGQGEDVLSGPSVEECVTF